MTSRNDLVDVLDVLCPMHVLLDPTGHIKQVGPTLQKLRPGTPMRGQRFLELFELRRPRAVTAMHHLMARSPVNLHLRFRDAPATALKGFILPGPDGDEGIVNLSFGISVLDAVRDYNLTAADFPATDLTVELLYLVEANSAAMEASRNLNQRLQGAMIAAKEQAYTDTLTNLKNRRALDFVLSRSLSGETPFAILHLDLDYFKQINDTMGHAAGDHVLQLVARIIQEETRETDTVARMGGDEFVLMIDRLTDPARLEAIAETLIARICQPFLFNGQTGGVSASIGIAICLHPGGETAEQMLHRADVALYAAKRAGRSRHVVYSPQIEARAPRKRGFGALSRRQTERRA